MRTGIGFSLPAGCPDFGRCCRRGVQGRRYSSFHIRPLGVERFIAGEGKAGSPCLGGERGPSNDAESLGYRVARPSVPEDSLFGTFGIFLAGRNVPYGARMGPANRTVCRFSVPRKTPRDKRQASQPEDRPIRSLQEKEGTLSLRDSISGIRLSRRRTARSRT